MDDVSLSCDDSLHSESLLHGTTTNMVTNMQRLTWLWGDAIDDEEIPNKGSPINTMVVLILPKRIKILQW